LSVDDSGSVWVLVVLLHLTDLLLNLFLRCNLLSVTYLLGNEFNQIHFELELGVLVFLWWQVLNPDSEIFDLYHGVIVEAFREFFLDSQPCDVNEEYDHNEAVKENSPVSNRVSGQGCTV
jgi:hypothetical protein